MLHVFIIYAVISLAVAAVVGSITGIFASISDAQHKNITDKIAREFNAKQQAALDEQKRVFEAQCEATRQWYARPKEPLTSFGHIDV